VVLVTGAWGDVLYLLEGVVVIVKVCQLIVIIIGSASILSIPIIFLYRGETLVAMFFMFLIIIGTIACSGK